MRKHNITYLLCLTVIVAVSGTTITAFRAHNQADKKPPHKSEKMIEQENRFPVTEFSATEPSDPKEQKRKEAKARRYAKTELSIDPFSDLVTAPGQWGGLSAIPVNQSAVIITGTISNAKTELTPERKKVYSDFTIIIDEVLKNDDSTSLVPGSTISADRAGGRVRFESGKIALYQVTGQGMPQVSGRYLLFLTSTDQESDYGILTGYELRDGRINLLDNPGDGHPITTSEGSDESSFLEQVRSAIANRRDPVRKKK